MPVIKLARIKVTLNNSGGELDSKTVAGEEAAARAAVELIESAGELYGGDTIMITNLDE